MKGWFFMKKLFALLLSIMMLVTVFGSCAAPAPAGDTPAASETPSDDAGESSGDMIKMEMYHIYNEESNEGPIIEAVVEEFTAANPNVELTNTTNAQIDYQVKLNSMIAAGTVPDVFLTRDDWLFDFMASNTLLSLDNTIAADTDWSGKFLDIWHEQTYEGSVYAVPTNFITNQAVYYNDTILQELGYTEFPTEWDEMMEVFEAAKNAGYVPTVFGGVEGWPIWSHLGEPLTQFMLGAEWVAEVGKFNTDYSYETPEFISVLTMINDLVTNEYLNPDVVAIGGDEALEYYYNSESLCFLSGSWTSASLGSQAPPEIFEVTKVASLPRPAGAKDDAGAGMFTGGSGWAWALNSQISADKLPHGETLIKQLTGNDTAIKYLEKGLMPPLALTEIEGADAVDMSSTLRQFLTLVAEAPVIYSMNKQQNGPVMADIIYNKCQEMMTGTTTPEEAAAAIQETYLEVAASRE